MQNKQVHNDHEIMYNIFVVHLHQAPAHLEGSQYHPASCCPSFAISHNCKEESENPAATSDPS
nr:hypothetical protein Iba_chr04cCG16610 [Ipomoea batatas]